MVDGNTPYMVPLNFGYRDMCLYFHGATKGKKIDILKTNPNVCFEFDIHTELVQKEKPCSWGMNFQSVIGFGTSVFIEDQVEKETALHIIMGQYSEKPFSFDKSTIRETYVFKVIINTMTGKQSGF